MHQKKELFTNNKAHLPPLHLCAGGWSKLLLVVLMSFLSTNVFAQEENSNSGFSGFFQPIFGIVQTKSLAAVTDENERLTSLDQNAKKETSFLFVPMWNLSYTFADEATSVWLGSSDDSSATNMSVFALGISHTLADETTFSLSYTPSIFDEDVWQDPFLVEKKRSETEMSAQNAEFAIESILGSPLSISYSFASQDIEKERAGYSLLGSSLSTNDLKSLRRSGQTHTTAITFDIPLGQRFIIQPGIFYGKEKRDGAANSSDQYGGQIVMLYNRENVQLGASFSAGYGEYDQRHPVFNKTREDSLYSTTLQMSYQAPFGFDDVVVSLLALYSHQDSNIHYYDESICAAGFGLTWSF